ncbi:MAG: General stress protein CTC [Candidatus Anoxychlamydiales bacterium]|nr:General stress protein CTC [Candidatus Anoxychlamydiales bacterium]
MQLTVYKRKTDTKKDINVLRHEGNIPAVLYSKGIKSENIYINKSEFEKILRTLKSGDLSTTIFKVKSEKETYDAIVKDIQYFITTYDISHLDLYKLNPKEKIKVNVPIRFIGGQACKGVKQGGTIRQILRKAKVKCFSKDMPKEFIVDVASLDVGDVKRLSDIDFPKGVDPITKALKEVVIAITKK